MPDPADEQKPADDDRNTYPGRERETDCKKTANQHQDAPDHIAFARSSLRILNHSFVIPFRVIAADAPFACPKK